jgi:hypothetical protein
MREPQLTLRQQTPQLMRIDEGEASASVAMVAKGDGVIAACSSDGSCSTTDRCPPRSTSATAVSRQRSIPVCSNTSAACTSDTGSSAGVSCSRSTQCSSSPRRSGKRVFVASKYAGLTSRATTRVVSVLSMCSRPVPPATPSNATGRGRSRASASPNRSASGACWFTPGEPLWPS